MKSVLSTLFLENPEIAAEIYQFCMNFPEYRQVQELAEKSLRRIEHLLGYEESNALEEALTNYYSWAARAYYLYGLHLRQDLCAALFSGTC